MSGKDGWERLGVGGAEFLTAEYAENAVKICGQRIPLLFSSLPFVGDCPPKILSSLPDRKACTEIQFPKPSLEKMKLHPALSRRIKAYQGNLLATPPSQDPHAVCRDSHPREQAYSAVKNPLEVAIIATQALKKPDKEIKEL